MPARTLNLGVLASGGGSNLQAIIDAAQGRRIDARVAVVVVDVPGARAIERAKRHAIPAFVVERRSFPSKQTFEEAIAQHLREHRAELVCLAGFMQIVGSTLLRAFPNRIINIHPALLPSFPGRDAQRQALEYGVRISGCTVHFVDEKIDHGPIIRQAAVDVEEGDTIETLRERILKEEHRIYPEAIELIAQGCVAIEGRCVRIAPRNTTPHPPLSPPATKTSAGREGRGLGQEED